MKILLVCNLGMSTSMLVKRMETAAEDKGITVEITAVPITVAQKVAKEWDIVMLGPQVRHQIKSVKEAAEGVVPVCVIDMRDYGLMNGENVLNTAIKLIEENKK